MKYSFLQCCNPSVSGSLLVGSGSIGLVLIISGSVGSEGCSCLLVLCLNSVLLYSSFLLLANLSVNIRDSLSSAPGYLDTSMGIGEMCQQSGLDTHVIWFTDSKVCLFWDRFDWSTFMSTFRVSLLTRERV